MSYRGRFAPSPTGPLHFGSLVAAVGSYLEARSRGGEWLVRMEDLDPPREMPGAADAILRTLEAFGLHWDGPVLYQNTRAETYQAALEVLRRQDAIYSCRCSRASITEAIATAGGRPGVYPGSCRGNGIDDNPAGAIRVRVAGRVGFDDPLQGRLELDLETEVGDFVIRRADGLFAYQLAVVVDDAAQGVTDVVRGSDLLDSTPRQIYLQRLLGLPTPRYLHLPVVLGKSGQKLSKQNLAPALIDADPVPALLAALAFLGQQPPAELAGADRDSVLQWAIAHWDAARLPRRLAAEPETVRLS